MIFEKEYLFYEKYHKNDTNKIIHIITIPIIVYTIFVWLSFIPGFLLIPNFGFIVFLGYSFYWFYLNPLAGISSSLFYIFIWGIASVTATVPGVWILSIFLHVISWVIQIYGHKKYENNHPAFFDSFLQAFTLAPLFIVCEVAFKYNCLLEVKADIDEYRKVNDFNKDMTNNLLNDDFTDIQIDT